MAKNDVAYSQQQTPFWQLLQGIQQRMPQQMPMNGQQQQQNGPRGNPFQVFQMPQINSGQPFQQNHPQLPGTMPAIQPSNMPQYNPTQSLPFRFIPPAINGQPAQNMNWPSANIMPMPNDRIQQ